MRPPLVGGGADLSERAQRSVVEHWPLRFLRALRHGAWLASLLGASRGCTRVFYSPNYFCSGPSPWRGPASLGSSAELTIARDIACVSFTKLLSLLGLGPSLLGWPLCLPLRSSFGNERYVAPRSPFGDLSEISLLCERRRVLFASSYRTMSS